LEHRLKGLKDLSYEEGKQQESGSAALGHMIGREATRRLFALGGNDWKKEQHLFLRRRLSKLGQSN
jgi:hypothetical protein